MAGAKRHRMRPRRVGIRGECCGLLSQGERSHRHPRLLRHSATFTDGKSRVKAAHGFPTLLPRPHRGRPTDHRPDRLPSRADQSPAGRGCLSAPDLHGMVGAQAQPAGHRPPRLPHHLRRLPRHDHRGCSNRSWHLAFHFAVRALRDRQPVAGVFLRLVRGVVRFHFRGRAHHVVVPQLEKGGYSGEEDGSTSRSAWP